MQPALSFQSTSFDAVDQNGQPWLQARQIGQALGYSRPDAVLNVYERNKDEFLPTMTATIEMMVGGNAVPVRIFSLRGCYALGMFARTPKAKEFRVWALDLLEREAQQQQQLHTSVAIEEPIAGLPHTLLWTDVTDYLEAFPPSTDDIAACRERTPFLTHGKRIKTCLFADHFKEWLAQRKPEVEDWPDGYVARLLRMFGCGYARYNVKFPEAEGRTTSRGVYVLPKNGPSALIVPEPDRKAMKQLPPAPEPQAPRPAKNKNRAAQGSMIRTLERIRDDLTILESTIPGADMGNPTLENAMQMLLLRNINRVERLMK